MTSAANRRMLARIAEDNPRKYVAVLSVRPRWPALLRTRWSTRPRALARITLLAERNQALIGEVDGGRLLALERLARELLATFVYPAFELLRPLPDSRHFGREDIDVGDAGIQEQLMDTVGSPAQLGAAPGLDPPARASRVACIASVGNSDDHIEPQSRIAAFYPPSGRRVMGTQTSGFGSQPKPRGSPLAALAEATRPVDSRVSSSRRFRSLRPIGGGRNACFLPASVQSASFGALNP